jgi:hypothetical protein
MRLGFCFWVVAHPKEGLFPDFFLIISLLFEFCGACGHFLRIYPSIPLFLYSQSRVLCLRQVYAFKSHFKAFFPEMKGTSSASFGFARLWVESHIMLNPYPIHFINDRFYFK